MFKVPEKYRVKDGPMGSDPSYENNGCFKIPCKKGVILNTIASDELGWEHVSVTAPHRPPTWKEMCYIKNLFWGAEDCVMQLHPPNSNYINNHPYCLHLWRPVEREIPQPHWGLVGVK